METVFRWYRANSAHSYTLEALFQIYSCLVYQATSELTTFKKLSPYGSAGKLETHPRKLLQNVSDLLGVTNSCLHLSFSHTQHPTHEI